MININEELLTKKYSQENTIKIKNIISSFLYSKEGKHIVEIDIIPYIEGDNKISLGIVTEDYTDEEEFANKIISRCFDVSNTKYDNDFEIDCEFRTIHMEEFLEKHILWQKDN